MLTVSTLLRVEPVGGPNWSAFKSLKDKTTECFVCVYYDTDTTTLKLLSAQVTAVRSK